MCTGYWVTFYILWFEYFCSATWDQFFLLYWSLHSLKTQNISVSDPTWLSLSCPSWSLDFSFYNCGWSLFWLPDPHTDPWVLLEPLFLGSRAIFLHCINQSACSLIHWSSYSWVAVNTSLPTVILGIINIWLLFWIVITMGKIQILSLIYLVLSINYQVNILTSDSESILIWQMCILSTLLSKHSGKKTL